MMYINKEKTMQVEINGEEKAVLASDSKSPCPRCGKLFLYPSFRHSMAGALSFCSEKCMDGRGELLNIKGIER